MRRLHPTYDRPAANGHPAGSAPFPLRGPRHEEPLTPLSHEMGGRPGPASAALRLWQTILVLGILSTLGR
jgi:hypothetical protein